MPREEITPEEQEEHVSRTISGRQVDPVPPTEQAGGTGKKTKTRKAGEWIRERTQDPGAVPGSLILIFGVCCFFLGALYQDIPFAEILKNFDYKKAWEIFISDGFELFLALSGAAFFGLLAHNTGSSRGEKGIRDSLTETKIFRTILDVARKADGEKK